MNSEPKHDDASEAKPRTIIKVKARYAASPTPFENDEVPATQTLATLKAAILAAFNLTEGSGQTYVLYHGRDELTDLTRTVGDVAGNAAALELKLSQTVTQG
jgi:hypothetical protein